MTEMKDKIYPELPTIREQPTAPNIVNGGADDRGHSYRLKIIREVQNFLEEEINKWDAFSKKYFRIAKVVNMVLGIGGVVTGAISLIGNIGRQQLKRKNI